MECRDDQVGDSPGSLQSEQEVRDTNQEEGVDVEQRREARLDHWQILYTHNAHNIEDCTHFLNRVHVHVHVHV